MVYISPDNKNVSVYTIPGDKYLLEDDEQSWNPSKGIPSGYVTLYTKRVLNVKVEKIFVGKSPKNNMTLFSCGHGKGFEGNTILLHKKTTNTYT